MEVLLNICGGSLCTELSINRTVLYDLSDEARRERAEFLISETALTILCILPQHDEQ